MFTVGFNEQLNLDQMKIGKKYSHLGAEEFLLVHQKGFYSDIQNAIIGASENHIDFEKSIQKFLKNQNWKERKLNHDESDFIRNKVALQLQIGRRSPFPLGLFSKHLMSYFNGTIDLAIEIFPTKKMQSQMPSGVAYYEGEVYNVLRHGRGNPPVPLLILGIEP